MLVTEASQDDIEIETEINKCSRAALVVSH